MTSLSRTAFVGIASNAAGAATLVLVQIASTAATARLIAPREFGVYATAQALAGFAGYFTMRALGNGLQRRPFLGEKTVGTALVLSVASGLVVASVVWISASAWAGAWGVPAATRLIRVVAVTLLLTCASTVPLALLRRGLRFGTAAMIEAGSQVTAAGVGVALAFILHSAMALALGQAIGSALLLMSGAAFVWRELQLRFAPAEARELVTFAGQVGFLNLWAYAVNTAPSWFAARAFGPLALGFYSRANRIVGLPLTYTAEGITKVLYPLYGRVRQDAARTRALLEEALILTAGLAWPAFALVAGASPVVVRVLLGDRWSSAAPYVALCALIASAELPCVVATNAGEALGWMRLILVRQGVLLLGVGVTLGLAHAAGFGLRAVLAGVALSEWVTYALTLVPFVRRGLIERRPLVQAHIIHGAVAVVTYGAAAAAIAATRGAPLAVQLAVVLAVGLGVLAALVAFRSYLPAGRIAERRFAQAFGEHLPARTASPSSRKHAGGAAGESVVVGSVPPGAGRQSLSETLVSRPEL